MNDLQIRHAFEHLNQDVLEHVPTEQRLTTVRRQRMPRFALAFAGAAAVAALVVGAAAFLGGPTEDTSVGTSPSVAPTAPPTTLPPTTSAPTPDGFPVVAPGTPIVATDEGLWIITESGPTLVTDEPVHQAAGDGFGGIVYLTGENTEYAAFLLRPGDVEPTVLPFSFEAEGVPSKVRLEDVAVIDATPHAIYVVTTGLEENRSETVWLQDLSTMESRELTSIGAYEHGITRVSFGGGRFVLSHSAEGFVWFELLDADGNPAEGPNPKPLGESETPFFVDQAALSPSGTRMVFLESDDYVYYNAAQPLDLVVWDMSAGTEEGRLRLPPDAVRYLRVDFDGSAVVLSRDALTEGDEMVVEALWIRSLDPDAGIIEGTGFEGIASLAKG